MAEAYWAGIVFGWLMIWPAYMIVFGTVGIMMYFLKKKK